MTNTVMKPAAMNRRVVTTGAATAEPRAEPDQQSAGDDDRHSGIEANGRRSGQCGVAPGRCDQPDKKGDAPGDIAGAGRREIADDAADAGDPTVGDPQ
jgi:hypothetical protein